MAQTHDPYASDLKQIQIAHHWKQPNRCLVVPTHNPRK